MKKKVMTMIVINRYGFADLISQALSAFTELTKDEPETYHEAMKSKDKEKWLQTMREEISSLKKNGIWILVEQHKNQKLVGCKWIFKRNEGISGVELPRYKARLIDEGFIQKEGIDYNQIFSPVVKQTSIRIILSLVARFDLELDQIDVTIVGTPPELG